MKNLLRTTALLLIFNSSFLITKAQWVSIPDSNFGKWLFYNGYSQCLQGDSVVGWQMDTTCNAVITATQVDCSYRLIEDLTGIQYFDNLHSLSCVQNHLTTLPVLSDSLTYLSCTRNYITSMPVLPNALAGFYCDNNHLSILPALPSSLTFLNCASNYLTNLPSLSGSLVSLICPYNQLASLPTLPNSLTLLNCDGNQLSNLPVLPNALKTLHCNDNHHLNSLPALSSSLTYLDCSLNQLDSLPAVPNSLNYLDCNSNQLSSLPAIPSSLNYLDCNSNHLSSLPALPNSLSKLLCNANQLSSLSILPDSLLIFNCSDNLYLHCLPQLKKIRNFTFTNTGITCLPNYPQNNITSTPSFITYPLCDTSSYNVFGCAAYWNISGKIYGDTSTNCLYDVAENTFGNLKVQLYENGVLEQQIFSSKGGVYSINTDLSVYHYSIDTSSFPLLVACPSIGYYTSNITVLDSFDADMNFGLRCKPGFDLAAQSISAIGFQPANIVTVNISAGDATNFYGAHCVNGVSGSVQLIIGGAAHYASTASGAITPTSVVNDTATWDIADFGTANFFHDFNINVATDTTAVLGSQICFTLIVNPIAGDNNPANNILTHCFTVVSSFDPNEKEVYPAGNIDTATHWLTYTIHFQNTGTAEAQHIYLTDTLDSNIDAASFQLLAYSHQPMVQLKGNSLRFNFPNINLPDSNTNEPLSHGYVQYKVKLKDNLPVGTNINNTAFIYFDFNAPVVTNTTSNTIALATSVANLGLRNADFGLNPNPATESVRISIDESMVGCNLTITDITGREVLHSAIQIPARTTDDVQSGGRNPQFDIRNLSHGLYFVTLESKTGRVTKKLVKQ